MKRYMYCSSVSEVDARYVLLKEQAHWLDTAELQGKYNVAESSDSTLTENLKVYFLSMILQINILRGKDVHVTVVKRWLPGVVMCDHVVIMQCYLAFPRCIK